MWDGSQVNRGKLLLLHVRLAIGSTKLPFEAPLAARQTLAALWLRVEPLLYKSTLIYEAQVGQKFIGVAVLAEGTLGTSTSLPMVSSPVTHMHAAGLIHASCMQL